MQLTKQNYKEELLKDGFTEEISHISPYVFEHYLNHDYLTYFSKGVTFNDNDPNGTLECGVFIEDARNKKSDLMYCIVLMCNCTVGCCGVKTYQGPLDINIINKQITERLSNN